MPVLSITRLRLRSWRFLPHFALLAWQAVRQVSTAPGYLNGALLPDRRLTFWTVTVWTDEAALKAYMFAGAHQRAMPRLVRWCDEAAVARYDVADATLPTWTALDARMRESGRPSRVRYPSAVHASLTFAPVRTRGSAPLKPRSSRTSA